MRALWPSKYEYSPSAVAVGRRLFVWSRINNRLKNIVAAVRKRWNRLWSARRRSFITETDKGCFLVSFIFLAKQTETVARLGERGNLKRIAKISIWSADVEKSAISLGGLKTIGEELSYFLPESFLTGNASKCNSKE